MPAPPQQLRRTSSPSLSRRAVAATGAAVFILLLLVYLTTLMPTVVDQDSGELVSACHVLGIAHPTGYPLWVMLGRAFDFLPIGHTSAYRIALLSAVCTAGGAALVAVLALGLTSDLLAAALAGLAFGLWFPAWSQAVRAEVYGLTALLFALVLLTLMRWETERSPRALLWLSLACGFVSMHHRTAFLAALPSLALALALTRPHRLRTYLVPAAVFVAPFAFYAYLPIRALARPPLNWTDPSTLDRFLDHVFASQYQFLAFSHSFGEMMEVGSSLIPDLLAPGALASALLAGVALPLAAWGWVRWLRKERYTAASLGIGAALLCFWVLQWGETSDLKVFLLPFGEIAALCAAIGLAAMTSALRSDRGWIVAAALGVLLLGTLMRANWERSDLSNLWAHRDRWAAVLTQLEPSGVYVSDFDVPSFATLYLQNVEGLRQDVTLVRSTRVPDKWYVDLIDDAELRQAVTDAWQEAKQQAPEIHEQTASFAYHLAKRLEGSRPVYVLHGPLQNRLEGPPFFVGLSEDLVRLQAQEPSVLRQQVAGAALAEFPGRVSLVGFEWDKPEAGTGEVVGFTVRWRLGGPPPPMQFAIGLAPEVVEPRTFRESLAPKGRFIQGFPLVYGLPDLSASPDGTVYEQRAAAIIPTNAPPGRCATAIAYGPLYGSEYQGWTLVGGIQVRHRPLPTNGP